MYSSSNGETTITPFLPHLCTINGILSFDKEGLSYEVSKDGLVIKNIKTDNITQTLLNNMISLLKELEKDYPTNVEVK